MLARRTDFNLAGVMIDEVRGRGALGGPSWRTHRPGSRSHPGPCERDTPMTACFDRISAGRRRGRASSHGTDGCSRCAPQELRGWRGDRRTDQDEVPVAVDAGGRPRPLRERGPRRARRPRSCRRARPGGRHQRAAPQIVAGLGVVSHDYARLGFRPGAPAPARERISDGSARRWRCYSKGSTRRCLRIRLGCPGHRSGGRIPRNAEHQRSPSAVVRLGSWCRNGGRSVQV